MVKEKNMSNQDIIKRIELKLAELNKNLSKVKTYERYNYLCGKIDTYHEIMGWLLQFELKK